MVLVIVCCSDKKNIVSQGISACLFKKICKTQSCTWYCQNTSKQYFYGISIFVQTGIFQIHKDMCTRREMMSLPVFCSYHSNGCKETPIWKKLLVRTG